MTADETFRCNKLLLRNNSVYFSNLFDFNDECSLKSHTPSKILKHVLMFVLCDYLVAPCKLLTSEVVDLIRISKLYHLPRLTSICEYQLIHASFADSESTLKIAVENGLKNLKQHCAEQEVRKLEKSE